MTDSCYVQGSLMRTCTGSHIVQVASMQSNKLMLSFIVFVWLLRLVNSYDENF